MDGHGVRRAVRHLLGMTALHRGESDYGPAEIDITLRRPMRAREKVFKCPRCQGIKRALLAPTCLGVNRAHAGDPRRMRTADSLQAPADTADLKVR